MPDQRLLSRLLLVLPPRGCLDAVCVGRLGGLSASVITGNVVQLAHGLGGGGARLLTGAAVLSAGTGWACSRHPGAARPPGRMGPAYLDRRRR